MTKKTDVGPKRPSRAEVEKLLLLDATGPTGGTPAEIADRLGLPATLAGAVGEALRALVNQRLLEVVEEEADELRLTEFGRGELEKRLGELGVSAVSSWASSKAPTAPATSSPGPTSRTTARPSPSSTVASSGRSSNWRPFQA